MSIIIAMVNTTRWKLKESKNEVEFSVVASISFDGVECKSNRMKIYTMFLFLYCHDF